MSAFKISCRQRDETLIFFTCFPGRSEAQTRVSAGLRGSETVSCPCVKSAVLPEGF